MDKLSDVVARMRSLARQRVCPGMAVLIGGTSADAMASSLARMAGLRLYRVDLNAVSRKYIGETEKNLDALFEDAESRDAILFLDEADALFGKRSDVSDSHDRYAERVALLTKRIGGFNGVVIVAGSDSLVSAPELSNAFVMDVQLPDLNGLNDVDIVADNIRALGALYFAHMLEETRIFAVVDRLAALFAAGMLPIRGGALAESLVAKWSQQQAQLSAEDRRNLYSRAFGAAGGDAGVTPNRDFPEIWLRFISAVTDSLQHPPRERVARDLAVNMSEHGYGMALFVACQFRAQMKNAISVLSDSEVTGAFDARDMWGVIDHVSTNYLDGATNSHRYAEMAQAGANIIGWLARHVDALNHCQWPGDDVDPGAICKQWLAARGPVSDVGGWTHRVGSADSGPLAPAQLLATLADRE
jgi:SpoVK/Ycf46/Vps4 family AAA+-type ATPase